MTTDAEKLKQAEDALREASRAFDSAKIWAGMNWSFSPIHPRNYIKARDAVNAYWNARQKEQA